MGGRKYSPLFCDLGIEGEGGGLVARLSYMSREGRREVKWQEALLQCSLNTMGAL